ncbi:hypothetical protein [Sulfurimonas sp.]|uniref:hypothetical protein n=1 Tax=Sulfurimonas sp. TaxID=2022749 RepID=UPI003D142AF4
MAVGPIGNAIFVNQMTQSATALQNAHNNRVDFQNMIAQAQVQEKEEEVLEVRPTEENQEVDPDREHMREEADQENKRSKKREANNEDEETDEEAPSIYKLDIKV